MQRTIILLRHANTERATMGQADIARPLSAEGFVDAAAAGTFLLNESIKPDCIITSTACRTIQTAEAVAEILSLDKAMIQQNEDLYNGTSIAYEEAIYALPNELNTIMIVGHNPAITSFANQMISSFNEVVMPKCAMMAVSLDIEDWSSFSLAHKQLSFYYQPHSK